MPTVFCQNHKEKANRFAHQSGNNSYSTRLKSCANWPNRTQLIAQLSPPYSNPRTSPPANPTQNRFFLLETFLSNTLPTQVSKAEHNTTNTASGRILAASICVSL